MKGICQGTEVNVEAARGFWLPLVFEEVESLRVWLLSGGSAWHRTRHSFAVSGAFHRHRRLSLDSSAGLETIKSEASEFLPCPVRDGAKSGRSRALHRLRLPVLRLS